MIKVRVPATSANMGAGFDTLGVALNLYSRMEFEEIPEGLLIYSANASEHAPRDENNLIYRAMKSVFDETGYEPTGVKIVQNSRIPMTRGLGSSSACIVGGMLAANVMSGRKLSYKEIMHLAAKMEGHPDNAGPALYGGFCVSMTEETETIVKSAKLPPTIKFAVMIPDYFVATRKSRGALPEEIPIRDAAFNISRALMFRDCLISGDMKTLRYAVEDRMHQRYRKEYIDGMDEIFEKTYELGSCATYLSGSGPTIVSVLDKDYMEFNSGMRGFFEKNSHQWTCMILSVDNVGAALCEI